MAKDAANSTRLAPHTGHWMTNGRGFPSENRVSFHFRVLLLQVFRLRRVASVLPPSVAFRARFLLSAE